MNNLKNIQMIVGLGNIGAQYHQTRHNAGFWLLDQLAKKYNILFKYEQKFSGKISSIYINQHRIYVLKPSTLMNISGKSVLALSQFYKINPDNIMVIHDDLDICVGRIKIKNGGGHGGHNGLRNIISTLNNSSFLRMRIGIGRPQYSNVADYVLKKPSIVEQEKINLLIQESLYWLPDILCGDRNKAIQNLHYLLFT